MHLHALIAAVYYEPSLITPAAHASIRQLLEHRFGGGSATDLAARAPGEGICGEEVSVEEAFVDEFGIAHIPIGGALGQAISPFDRGSGAVDTLDIRKELATFDADEKVRAAILDFDSPGGMALGTPETADAIASFSKPIYAFTRGMIASAAYWMAAACDGIYASQSASVGSIGTVISFNDLSEMAKMQGIKVEVIKSGTFKGMGTPGTSLTEAQRNHLQARVDILTAQFKSYVVAHRGPISDEAMQGQMHLAGEALSIGLIDGIMDDKEELVRHLLDSGIISNGTTE